MEKDIKRQSLLIWIIFCFTVCIIISLTLSVLIYRTINTAQASLMVTKVITPEGHNNSSTISSNLYYSMDKKIFVTGETKNGKLFTLLEWMKIIAPTLIFGISIFISAFLLYHRKLRIPIHALKSGITCIENQDLNFHISYEDGDELGDLCRAFNTMRDKLDETFASLWKEQEKQNIMTRAIAHDLRTPLSVIKGNSELIDISLKDETVNIQEISLAKAAIDENIGRMEYYLESTRKMMTLGDWQLNLKQVTGRELSEKIRNLQNTDKRIQLQVEDNVEETLSLDETLVIRVLENIITNAMEYAASRVIVTLTNKDERLKVQVTDDGKGFSADALKQAATPYYRGDRGRKSGHMGLGLTIAQILTKCHHGELTWGNHENGAYVEVLFQSL